jgi:serine/threonine protein phosphatase PrpC
MVKEDGGALVAKALSTDQTPYRRDERARVRKAGARVLNMDQLEGLEAIHDDWDMNLGDEVDEGGDPPRIWSQDGAYPGTAFTRSFGDSIAEELGVFAEPETLKYDLSPADKFMVVASDGVWEFLTNKEVVEIAAAADDPQEAACLLWKAAYKEWITKEVRTDDITVIVVDISGYYANGGSGGAKERDVKGGKAAGTRRGSLANNKK